MIDKNRAIEIFEYFFADCDTRGMMRIDLLVKQNKDKSIVVFEVEQWKEEVKADLYDYSYIILDENGNVLYDEANGEMKKENVYKIFNDINGIKRLNVN